MKIRRIPRSISLAAACCLIALLACDAPAVEKNGFNLSKSLIPANEIFSGGPPKDGIPALDKPKFVTAKNAAFLNPGDRVLGLVIDGQAKAYPIGILNWHEIVNDDIRGHPLTVTYCPLCGTGVAFSSRVKGKTLQFGVSGLLYNSDVLLYDRQTSSLWSQIMGQAISGRFKGRRLEMLPTSHTTWRKWQAQHPATLVLSTETGFSRNYQRNPYAGYEKTRRLYFRVAHQAPEAYHPKELIIGLNADGVYKAYPFIELTKNGQAHFEDIVNKQSYTIHWDAKNRSASITNANGKTVPIIQGYWFAWYAFHPTTQIFTAKSGI